MSVRTTLAEHAASIALFDTHEHLALPPADWLPPGMWGLLTGHYVYVDFHLAGAPLEAFAQRPESVEEEWAVFAPYLETVQTTAYFRFVWAALQQAFDFSAPELTADLYADLDQRLRAAQADPAWGKRLVQETAGIERALLDTFWDPVWLDPHTDLFDPVLRLNGFVMCPWEGLVDHNGNSFWFYQDLVGVTVTDFRSYLDLFEAMLERHCRGGAVAVKLALAYDRPLDFQPVDRGAAERIWQSGPTATSPEQRKVLQDFLTFYAVGRATERGLPVQIHTGILEGRRGRSLLEVSPLGLIPLLSAYPQARFDLFHAGFPYARELGTIAMGFPNVWADLCWVPLISDAGAVQILEEWIDMLPGNKLLWGGDCTSPVAVLGAAIFGRRVVVEALARKVEGGSLSEKQALRLTERILRDNGFALFHPPEKD